jgi:hypothetical protein
MCNTDEIKRMHEAFNTVLEAVENARETIYDALEKINPEDFTRNPDRRKTAEYALEDMKIWADLIKPRYLEIDCTQAHASHLLFLHHLWKDAEGANDTFESALNGPLDYVEAA